MIIRYRCNMCGSQGELYDFKRKWYKKGSKEQRYFKFCFRCWQINDEAKLFFCINCKKWHKDNALICIKCLKV